MINREHKLSVVRQCELLGLARSGAYYEPRPVSSEDLALMRRIDELHLEHPFAGARMLRDILRGEGNSVGRKHGANAHRESLRRRPVCEIAHVCRSITRDGA